MSGGEARGRSDGVKEVAAQLGVHTETIRKWMTQLEVDQGRRPGLSSAKQRIRELERENSELRINNRTEALWAGRHGLLESDRLL